MARIKEFTIDTLDQLINLLDNELDILSLYGITGFLGELNQITFSDDILFHYLLFDKIICGINVGDHEVHYTEVTDTGEVESIISLSGKSYIEIYNKVQWITACHTLGCIKPIINNGDTYY